MRKSTCAEYARQVAQESERHGDFEASVIASMLADLLDVHGCGRQEADTERVEMLGDGAQCPACGHVVKGAAE